MSILQILAAFIIGVIILMFAIIKNNKGVMLFAAIPLLIAISQIVILVLMALH